MPIRSFLTALLIVSFLVAPTFADDGSPKHDPAKARSSRALIWLGVGLVAAGAVAMPVTGVRDQSRFTPSQGTGFALISGGAALILWGFHRRAAMPQTTGAAAPVERELVR